MLTFFSPFLSFPFLFFSRDTMFKITIPLDARRVLQENCIRRMPLFCSTTDDPMRFLLSLDPPPPLFTLKEVYRGDYSSRIDRARANRGSSHTLLCRLHFLKTSLIFPPPCTSLKSFSIGATTPRSLSLRSRVDETLGPRNAIKTFHIHFHG